MKTYRYLYYKLYCIWLKKKNESENAHINAIITLTFTLYVNFMSIVLIVLVLKKIYILSIIDDIKADMRIVIPVILVIGGIINYLLLARKKLHEKIVEEFKSESEKKRKRGMVCTVIYLILTIGIPMSIIFTVSLRL